MSGSYDRSGHPGGLYDPGSAAPDYGEFHDETPRTGAPSRRGGDRLSDHQEAWQTRQSELTAHSREDIEELELRRTPIVPAGSVTGRSLVLVVSIMCFLACLTAGAVYMINESASAWLRDIASEVTVQVEPRQREDLDRTVAELTAFLAQQRGIVEAKPFSRDQSAALLEPWLGQTDALDSLPMPRLIAVEIARDAPPDLTVLKAQLAQRFPNAQLDDHRQWQQQIRSVTRSLALGGLTILLLVAAATTAIIISATQSAMASNKEIVEVLHFVGATDRFIAREFEGHFLRLGIRAGLVGAVLAMAMFFLLPFGMQLMGGGSVTQVELSRLIGTGTLDLKGYLLLLGLVVVISALCMLTSRFGVYRILHAQQ